MFSDVIEQTDWRVTFRDAETDQYIRVRVTAEGSYAAMAMASRMVEEGSVGQGRAWLCFEHCESLPDREWSANSSRLGLLQRALQRSDMELQGHREHYAMVARRVAVNIIDRGA